MKHDMHWPVLGSTALIAVSLLTGCSHADKTPPAAVPQEATAPVAAPVDKPSGIEGELVVVTATVKAIDKKNRVVTLKFPDGKEKKVKSGPEVRNFAQIRVGDEVKAQFLSALSRKGETSAEVAGFAEVFRALATDPGMAQWAPRAVDIVGTGGDHAGGFNVSSLVTLVVACAGVPVMKHGNRGITSKCGSADLLAALGVDLAAPPEKLRRAMPELGFVFLFAPNFHPAFKHVAAVRKALAEFGDQVTVQLFSSLKKTGIEEAEQAIGSWLHFDEPESVPVTGTSKEKPPAKGGETGG